MSTEVADQSPRRSRDLAATTAPPITGMYEDWGERDARWAGIRSELVTVRHTHVHVLRADGRRDGPTQLLIHGLGGSATNWLEVMVGLAEHGPVVAPDLPGFGRTEPPPSGSSRIRASLGFLDAFARVTDLDAVTVHGNSMGGMLAVQLAARRPDLVERLVLVDPALPGPRVALHQLDRQTLLTFGPFAVPRLGRRLINRLHATRTAEQLYGDNQRFVHGDPTRVRAPLLDVGRESVVFAQRTPWRLDSLAEATESVIATLLSGRGLWRAVGDVRAPTLLLWGDADRLVGRRIVDAVLARRPDWDLHVFVGVGHIPMVEVPDRYLDAVRGWYG